MIFDNGASIEDKELKECQIQIVDVLKRYTTDLKLAKLILQDIDLDDFATIKDD